MGAQAPLAAPKPRRLRFALWALAAVTIGGITLFCIQRLVVRAHARYECDRIFAAWESGLATASEACEASRQCLLAEMAVPFADCDTSASSHLDRVERVWLIAYGPLSEWRMGVKGEAELAQAQAGKAEVDRYYQEAKQIAARECKLIWIGCVDTDGYDVVYHQLRAANIVDQSEMGHGIADIVVEPRDIPRAREILLAVRQQDPESVFWIRGVDPPFDIHFENFFSKYRRQVLLKELEGLPDFYEHPLDYRVDPYLHVAAKLQALDRQDAIETLTTVAEEGNYCVFVLCRMLFVKRAGGEFWRPAIGGHGSNLSHADWPLEPIEIVDGVPFLVYWDWMLGGEAEEPKAYLDYCLQHCDWNPERFKAKSPEEKQKALAKLLESKNWKSPLREEVKQALSSTFALFRVLKTGLRK